MPSLFLGPHLQAFRAIFTDFNALSGFENGGAESAVGIAKPNFVE